MCAALWGEKCGYVCHVKASDHPGSAISCHGLSAAARKRGLLGVDVHCMWKYIEILILLTGAIQVGHWGSNLLHGDQCYMKWWKQSGSKEMKSAFVAGGLSQFEDSPQMTVRYTNRRLSLFNGALVNALANSASSDNEEEEDEDNDKDETPVRDAFQELERQGESHVTTGEVLMRMDRTGQVSVTRSNPSGLPSAPLVGTAAGTIGTLFPFIRRGASIAGAVAGGAVQTAAPGQVQLQQVGQTSICNGGYAVHCYREYDKIFVQ